MSREDSDENSLWNEFRLNLAKDKAHLDKLDTLFFPKYSFFGRGMNDIFGTVSEHIKMPSTTGLENRLVIEVICGVLEETFENGQEDEILGYTTHFICTGSVYIPEKKALIHATSYSKSNYFDDTTLYEDLRGISYAFNPELAVDVFVDEDFDDLFRQRQKPFRIKNEEFSEYIPIRKMRL